MYANQKNTCMQTKFNTMQYLLLHKTTHFFLNFTKYSQSLCAGWASIEKSACADVLSRSIDLCAAAPAKSFACAGDLPQILHGFHPGK